MCKQANLDTVVNELYAKALGDYIMQYIRPVTPSDILPLVEHNAAVLIHEIKAILDDETLDDPACFRRIDAIVDAFHKSGISTTRHDF